MSWFRKKKTIEVEEEPRPVRVATDEFLYGLQEIANIYKKREKQNRVSVNFAAQRLSQKEFFNHEELEHLTGEIQKYIMEAISYQGLASEIDSWIRGYKYRGWTPDHIKEAKKILPVEDDILTTTKVTANTPTTKTVINFGK